MNIVCLVVDRLQPALLGAYGNTWIRTPEVDQLAAESFLFDQALADTVELPGIYRGWWQGLPAIWRESAKAAANYPPVGLDWLALAAERGWHTALITDEPQVSELACDRAFAERLLVKSDEPTQAADALEDTQAARLLATASDWLTAARQPFVLWLHARGMQGAWDAPYELRAQYADEEDPPPPHWVQPPSYRLPVDHDPDELLGVAHAYAGQVSLWDELLGGWLEAFRASPHHADTLVCLLSPRGYPLGEHLQVGASEASLANESVQTVWICRFPDGLGAAARSQAVAIPADLPATCADWLRLPHAASAGGESLLPLVRWQRESVRDCVALLTDPRDPAAPAALRTPAWHLAVSGSEPNRKLELFAKPSDRYEVNDVANRLPQVTSELLAVLDNWRATPQIVPPAVLDSSLTEALD